MGSQLVSARDALRLLRLSHELRDLPADLELRKKHLVEGLCRLVDAQVGIFADGAGFGPGLAPNYTGAVEGGWLGDAEREVYLAYLQEEHAADPCLVPFARGATKPITTRKRRELMADRDWYATRHVNDYRRAARVDDFIYSCYVAERGVGSGHVIGLHRPWGDRRPFGTRDLVLVNLLHRVAGPLLHASPVKTVATRTRESLPPRLRETLEMLLQGDSEKEVAVGLKLSRHTIHGYVKQLYDRFGVSSRAELMALLLSRL